MNMLALEEKRNEQKGMITSVIIHLLLLIFFLLYQAWPFDPPLAPQYGIEVNFGTSDVGSGDVQNDSEAGENTEENTEATETETQTEESSEVTEPTEQTETVEATSSVVESTEAVESEVESLEEASTETNTVTETEEVVEEVVEPTETEVEETVNEENVMGGSSSNNNNGDDENEVGDKGQEDGEINESDIYKGTNGGGNGSSYDLAGWKWDKVPKPKDETNENGKIVFKIKVDEEGYIESVSVVESGVSAATVAIYKREVEKITFSRTAGGNVPLHSNGTVTFIIKSR